MTRVTVHVPLFLNDGTPTPEGTLDLIERDILDVSDGFTAVDGIGAWRSPSGQAYREPVRQYHVDFPTRDPKAAAARLAPVVRLVADALDQEAVYVTAAPIFARAMSPTRDRQREEQNDVQAE